MVMILTMTMAMTTIEEHDDVAFNDAGDDNCHGNVDVAHMKIGTGAAATGRRLLRLKVCQPIDNTSPLNSQQ